MIPEHRKNRDLRKKGLNFDQGAKELIVGKGLRMVSILSCETFRGVGE
jgi:hypothetical protein